MALADRTRIVQGTPQVPLITTVDVDMPASYTTGGEVLGVADFVRVGNILGVIVLPNAGFNFRYDAANDKILAFRTGAINLPEEEVPNAVDISAALNTRVMIFHTPS